MSISDPASDCSISDPEQSSDHSSDQSSDQTQMAIIATNLDPEVPRTSVSNSRNPIEYMVDIDDIYDQYSKKKLTYVKSSEYYSWWANWISIPNIVISGIASFLSFMAASTIVDEKMVVYINLFIGFLTTTVAISQSIDKNQGFSTKASDFRKAAESLSELLIKIQMEKPRYENNPHQLFEMIERDVLKIKTECKFFTPSHIAEQVNTGKLT